MTTAEDVKRVRVDEQFIRKCQRELRQQEKSVRSSLFWFGIVVLCLTAALAIHYFDF